VSPSDSISRLRWPLLGVFALVVYFHGVDGLYIPHIGDEAPYIEIARLTAESGRLLPLETAPGLENTKPPLLFWMGIAATDWGRSFTLWRLRTPVVLLTFATAFAVFWLAARLGLGRDTASLAALTYLGFYSTFHYGRPFLTNSPETLFVFLSFAIVLAYRKEPGGLGPFVLAGAALGAACLFKSFALVAPLGAALFWLLAAEHGLDFRRVVFPVGLTVALGLAGFCLWPLLDPEPANVIRHFVLEENVGKIAREGYLEGLYRGPYAIQWLWLGSFFNAGFFAVPLALVAVSSLRNRMELPREEKALWILVLSFLVVYSIPAQRQENYLLPTTPALALLVAKRWSGFSRSSFRWFALPGVIVSALLLHVVLAVRREALPEGSYASWHLAILALVLLGWILALAAPGLSRTAFHGLVLASFFLVSVATAPFEGPLGRFELERMDFLEGETVFVPTEFISRHERHRFLLPGFDVEGYDPADANEASRLLDSGEIVVIHRTLGEDASGPFRVLARRFDLRSRQTKSEMWRIAVDSDLDLLVRQELVVRRYRRDRMMGEP
jgi:4-amino-4-deoxy-L-arabinose transferase-like glycosyltransferase